VREEGSERAIEIELRSGVCDKVSVWPSQWETILTTSLAFLILTRTRPLPLSVTQPTRPVICWMISAAEGRGGDLVEEMGPPMER
jgi:hypothetical protein